MRVLLVEDHPVMRGLVQDHLRLSGWTVESVGSGKDALAALAATGYDAVVLDLGLPDMDGTEVMRRMRAAHRPCAPCMILTARSDMRDRLLTAGADDHVLKPFDLVDFERRLRAIVRHPGERREPARPYCDPPRSTPARRIEVGGAEVDLTHHETSVLEALVGAGGRPVVMDLLEDRLRGCGGEPNTDGLKTTVSALRRKLVLAGSFVGIEALPGIGYRLRGA